MAHRLPVAAGLEPVGVRPVELLGGVRGVEARHHPHPPPARRRRELPEDVAVSEVPDAGVEGDPGGVEGDDAAAAHGHAVELEAGVVLDPLLHVEVPGVLLVQVELPPKEGPLVPGGLRAFLRRRGRLAAEEKSSRPGGGRARRREGPEELPAAWIPAPHITVLPGFVHRWSSKVPRPSRDRSRSSFTSERT